ncbi:Maf family protein [Thermodesulfobacteriota bacterium]
MKNPGEDPVLILASKSPQRRYLLEKAGLSFSVIPSDIDETTLPLLPPEVYVRVLSEAKAEFIAKKYSEKWVIGADTIVLKDGVVLGKPGSIDEARSMLKQLSGQTHQVFTGYSVLCKAKNRKFSETVQTEVLFKNLTDEEIEWYIHTKEPFDKAGAYAIQGLGTFLVKRINGSYTNVVGLPVCEVIEFLIKEGVVGLTVPTN